MAFLFPHLCLKEELMELLMNKGASETDLLDWVKVNHYFYLDFFFFFFFLIRKEQEKWFYSARGK